MPWPSVACLPYEEGMTGGSLFCRSYLLQSCGTSPEAGFVISFDGNGHKHKWAERCPLKRRKRTSSGSFHARKGAARAPFFVLQLLSYDENVLRRSACSLDFGNLGVRQVAADQNERRRDVIKVEGTQVGYVLAAAEHAESSPEIHLREQNKRNLRRLHTVS